jgi:hypothetical protein
VLRAGSKGLQPQYNFRKRWFKACDVNPQREKPLVGPAATLAVERRFAAQDQAKRKTHGLFTAAENS